MKIVGNTVGMGLPKPDLRQTNPQKGDYVKGKDEIPTKVSQLENDEGFITSYTETDPTVPSWAKQSQKPSYTASEVGALPNTTKIPSKTSDLTNDSGFITGYTETDPTVPAWAKATTKPSYSKSEVGLGNVDNVKQYSASNPPPYPVTSVNGKTGAVNLDASAVGARPSTWMPSASDVGALPSSTTIPTKTSQLTNDSGFIKSYTETDPTVPSWAKASSKPSYSKSEVGLGNVDNVKQYSASNPPPYPVTSVNGQTGAVTVSVPTKVSQLQNDSGFVTELEKNEIIQQVIDALGGSPIFGVVDANNNIILTGTLADGTYTLKYEDDEGNTHEIGNVTLGEKMVNQIPISTDTDGVTIFNGTGWKTGERVSSSGTIKTQASYELTGFMPFVKGDVLRGSAYILLREAITDVANANYNVISLYDVNKTFITNVSLALSSAAPAGITFGADRSFVFDSSLNSDVTDAVKFIRVTCAGISNGDTLEAIITINQEIE